ncbi:MAG: hypothetical protein KDD38_02970 [Bdellovibrionales bacterium]|nr:hypothetical protein [Bdellovibrionales bacterium]
MNTKSQSHTCNRRYFALILTAYCVINLPKAFAEEVVMFRGENETETEFEAQKLARNQSVGFDDFVAKQSAPALLIENLNQSFLVAQDHFLKSEIGVIENDWLDVTAFAHKADWAKPQREMIQTAYLRLAQIASDATSTRKYLLEALCYDDEFVPDQKLFPPPLIEQYNSLKSHIPKKELTFISAEGFSYALINGVQHRISSRTPLHIRPGTKRITYLSPTYMPVSRVLDTSEIIKYQPQKILAQKISAPTSKLKQRSLVKSAEDLFSAPTSISPSIENKMPSAINEQFYKKPKFWVGAAILAGVVYALKSQNNEKAGAAPTHREGL